ncbi:MAG: cytochrome c biogenesis protein CcdA [Alistipes sp.]|nr:cytochrome c biogenesis protein CcdA [Alistipes sp.]
MCRTKYRLTLCSVLLSLCWVTALFGANDPVRWSVESRQETKGRMDLIFTARIASPWHMYDLGPYTEGPNATTFTFVPNAQVRLLGGVEQLSTPTRLYDSIFGMQIGYFEREAQFRQRLEWVAGEQSLLEVTIEWMVCDDQQCMPPSEKELKIPLMAPATFAGASAVAGASPTTEPSAQEATPSDTLSSVGVVSAVATAVVQPSTDSVSLREATGSTVSSPQRSGRSLWRMIVEAVLWGLAALLTPCVFPMVPMTVSFFMKGASSSRRGRLRAVFYGGFIVALYTIPIGVIILITRLAGGESVTADLFNWLATHWIPNVLFFLVFMLFAASFFGAFDLTLPSSWVNRSDRAVDRGGVGGIFFLALTLVLVSFSCTGPIVGSVLIQSTAGEFWYPILTMLAFSLAFALPFTLLALFPTLLKHLPKSGGWLNAVKVVLGFLELALGLKFLSVADQTYHWGLLDREVYLSLWIVIFTLLGCYLLGKLRFAHDGEPKPVSVPRLFFSILTFAFVVYLLPGMWGAPLKGLSGYLPPLHTQDFVLPTATEPQSTQPSRGEDTTMRVTPKYSEFLHLPHGLFGFFNMAEAEAYARSVHKPLFVDYTGHGCVNCREMEARVWSDPEVLALLRRDFVIVALYSDDKKELPESEWVTTVQGRTLKGLGKINAYLAYQRFGVNAQPYYLILGDEGTPLLPGRGYDLNVEAFRAFLEQGLAAYRATQP